MQQKESPSGLTKVCFVITKGNWGGAQKYVYALARNLPKDKYEILVVCGIGGVLKEKLEEVDIRVLELKNLKRDVSFFKEIRSFWKLFRIIKKERPNVVHLNSPKAGGLGSVAAKLAYLSSFPSKWGDLKCIYTAHGWTFNEKRGVLQTVAISFISWLTVILCDKTIVIAEREKTQAMAMPFVKDSKIVLIRNGVREENFLSKDMARSKLLLISGRKVPQEAVWIGTIAELHKNKGLHYSIEALAKITSPYVFFIIGEGEERKKLERMIEYYNLSGKIFLTGFVNNADTYLSAFDMFLSSSIKEGLPYSILEAGLAEVPVIAPSIGGIPDIIDNGVTGILVSKERSGEIKRAVEYLIENTGKRELFGKNLREKVQKDFSIEQMVEKTSKLYEE